MFLLAEAITRAAYNDPSNTLNIGDIVAGTMMYCVSRPIVVFLQENGGWVGAGSGRYYAI